LISLGAEPDSPVPNIKIDGGSDLWKAVAKKANSSSLSLYAYRALHYSLSPGLVRKYSRRASIFHEEMSPLPIFSPVYQKRQPVFLTVNELRGPGSTKILGPLGGLQMLAEKILPRCQYDEVISASQWTQERLHEVGVQSTLIPNGVDTQKFRPSTSSKVRPFVIATVGRLVRHKGHQDFLRVAYYLRNEDFHFLIVGVGPEEGTLRLQAKQLGLERVTIFQGRLADRDYVELVRSSIDVYVHVNPFQEGFGFSVAEAMSCSKPVVAFDVPGVRSLIRNGENGFLVAPGDVKSMAGIVLSLANDSSLRSKIGRAARTSILENGDWNKSAKILTQLYAEYL